MVEANAAAVTGPTLGALQSLPTVSSLFARCSRTHLTRYQPEIRLHLVRPAE
jgi:hypothetical protein